MLVISAVLPEWLSPVKARRTVRSRTSAVSVGSLSSTRMGGEMPCPPTLTRLTALGTLSRTAGEGGPNPKGWVGEGSAAGLCEAAYPGGFIATSSMTLGRISRMTTRKVASCAAGAAAKTTSGGPPSAARPDRRKLIGRLDSLQDALQSRQPFGGLDVVEGALGGFRLRLVLDRGIDRFDRPISRERLVDGAAGLRIDARLQFPAFAARRQFGDQREHVVAILLMRAGQESETAVMLDDPVVILGKTELGERIVKRAARSDEQRRHMQAAAALRRFLLRHNSASRMRVIGRRSILGGVPRARDENKRASPQVEEGRVFCALSDGAGPVFLAPARWWTKRWR